MFVHNSQLELMNTMKVGYKQVGYVSVTDQFMFVASYSENKVYRVEMPVGGRQRALITGVLNGPEFVGSNGRKVAVCCQEEDKVYVFDTEGMLLHKYGASGTSLTQL